ncbi:hypothetical protein GCM10010341_76230 [Streptomyces noursei]|nr:hypothetical protein GCM10010341_76230 [Streptomyces noursei]
MSTRLHHLRRTHGDRPVVTAAALMGRQPSGGGGSMPLAGAAIAAAHTTGQTAIEPAQKVPVLPGGGPAKGKEMDTPRARPGRAACRWADRAPRPQD